MPKLRKPTQENSIETIKNHGSKSILKEQNSVIKLKNNTEIAIVLCHRISVMHGQMCIQSVIDFCDLPSVNRLLIHILEDLHDPTTKLISITLVVPATLKPEDIDYIINTFKRSNLGEAYKKLPKIITAAEHNHFCVTSQGKVEPSVDLQALKTAADKGQDAKESTEPSFLKTPGIKAT